MVRSLEMTPYFDANFNIIAKILIIALYTLFWPNSLVLITYTFQIY